MFEEYVNDKITRKNLTDKLEEISKTNLEEQFQSLERLGLHLDLIDKKSPAYFRRQNDYEIALLESLLIYKIVN
jgi:hypothetical protein